MMWDQVLERLKVLLAADVILAAIFAERMRMATFTGLPFSPVEPTLEWSLIGDAEGELWAPCIIQFDLWASEMAELIAGERRLRTMFHQPLPFDIGGGVKVWGEYSDGTMLASPSRDGFAGRAIRFRFTPLRSQYAGVPSSD